MNRLRNNTVENVKWIEVAGIALLFLLTPSIIGLPAIIYYVTSKRRPNKTNYYTFFICIAAYIGAVNATKHAGGDQINYAWAYLNVPTQGFIGSLKNIYGYRVAMGEKGATNISGEFMNGVYNYLGYYLTFGNYSLFIFLYSLMEIMLILMGVYHFSTQLKSPKMVLICGTITMCFFYMYFNLMLQIQKQFFGQAIMMYVIGHYARYGKMTKKTWIMMFASVFTHTTNILFIPFLLVKRLRSKMNKQTLMMMCVLFALLIIMGPSMAREITSSSDGSVLGYGLSRVANSKGLDDGLRGLDFTHPRVHVLLLPLLFVLYKKQWKERKSMNVTEQFLMNIMLLLILAVFAMFNQPTAQYRYFMMFYMFIPYIIPYIGRSLKERNLLLKGFASLSMGCFFLFFENIIWEYAPEFDIIFFSPIYLTFGGYYL